MRDARTVFKPFVGSVIVPVQDGTTLKTERSIVGYVLKVLHRGERYSNKSSVFTLLTILVLTVEKQISLF
jgi:hypothetical protein